VASGVLTPVPGADAETVVLAPDAETVFQPVAAGPAVPSADAATVFQPLPGDSAATVAAAAGGGIDTTGLPPSAGGVRQAPPPRGQTGPLTIGQQFGSRYIIVKLLGLGGMGAVYQAWDSELSVTVALKVVRPEVTKDPAAARDIERRFKQELLLARQVTHKNVVRIHDLGEIDGIKYITMSYIEGEDLASVLKKTGRQPIPAVMTLARQIAAGLQAANEAGVVHRDLKPANVMVEKDQHATIMDFGIARSTSRGGSAPAARSPAPGPVAASPDDETTRVAETIVGEVIGTIEYMAPEQARGEHVDQRADVYAFGLIVYDLLVGRRRSEDAPNAVAELQQRLAKAPPPVRSLVPEVPEALDGLITRCIQPEPADRFQTTAELVAALDRLDDNGKLRPVKRVVGLPLAAAVAAALLGLSGLTWWYTRPPVEREPVLVVLADFENRTGDPAFNGTLEPMLKRALEGASFISAYDRDAVLRQLGVRPPERFDEAAARAVAVQQGLGVVLAGAIEPQGRGYRVSVRATRAITAEETEEIASEQGSAASKDRVLETATRLITRVRSALGDEASESQQMFAMMTMTTTSFEVVRLYANALATSADGKFEETKKNLEEVIRLDPKFGLAYQSLASLSRNLGRLQEAVEYVNQATKYLDGMTEREQYNTRGTYARLTGDYEQCAREFGELLARYAADPIGYNQRALCLSKLRRMDEAVGEMQKVVKILPRRVVLRDNLSLYSSYNGDFRTGEEEARGVETPSVYTMIALAFAQLGQGQVRQAEETYARLATMSDLGASFAASGRGDLAMYEGRFSDAVRIFSEGAAADLAKENPDRAAAKFVWVANAQLSRGNPGAAVAAAADALRHSRAPSVRFLAARTFIAAGDVPKASPIVRELAEEFPPEPRAYAKILEAEVALRNKNPRQAILVLREANELFDTWIGHFTLGRAYFEEGSRPALLQADAEFEACVSRRRGEALSLSLDEEPTYGFLPAAYYYRGRVREGIGTEGYRDSYRTYLEIRGQSREDPLLEEVRRRAR
jgi:tetratricopeptide (TPR) repeat protein